MSRGFASTLGGLALTAFSWISPWAWPAWPALALMRYVFESSFAELSYATRSAIVVLLIAVNTAVWALLFHALLTLSRRGGRGWPKAG